MKKEHWRRMAEGWEPFPFQLSGWKAAERDGRIKADYDSNGRLVLKLTSKGREWMMSRPQRRR